MICIYVLVYNASMAIENKTSYFFVTMHELIADEDVRVSFQPIVDLQRHLTFSVEALVLYKTEQPGTRGVLA